MKLRFDDVAARWTPRTGPNPWARCRALVLGLFAFLPIQAGAAISVDFANGTFANSNTVSWNHTSSGAPNSVLLVGLSINSLNNVGLSVTYNGLPLTRTVTTGVGNPKAEIWYLWNPPAGTWPVVANITTPDKFCAGSVTYQGVGAFGATANRMTGFTTTADVSLTTTQADSWIFGVVSVGDNATLSSLAGQVSRYSQATTGGGTYNRGAGADKAMGAPALGTLSWDLGGSFTSGLAAIELRAFAAPTATRTATPTRTPTRTPSATSSPTRTATPCASLSGVGVGIGGGASGTIFNALLNVNAGVNRLLVASIDTDPGVSVVAVSFNGAPFSFAGSSGGNRNLETWVLPNPDVANVNVQVVTSASGAVNFGVVIYTGADTVTPIGVSASDSRGSNTGFNYDVAGVAPGSYVQGHTWTGAGGGIGRGAGQVSMWSGVQAGTVEGDIKTAPGGGTVNLLYTFTLAGVTEARAVEVRRAPCAAGPTPTFSPTRSPSPSPTPGAGACASLIRDIRPGLTGSSSMLTALLPGERVVFGADDGVSGSEPWVTDGTFAGTYQILDLFPGASAGFPLGFTSHGGWVYFAGNNGSVGQELWRTDGSLPGTTLVADIQPGATGSFPTNLFSWGGMLYFAANDGVNGSELWRWDGAVATLVKDINVGGGGSNPYGFTDAGAFFYFFAGNGSNGNELWRSDGSTAGTLMVKDINPGAGSSNGGEAVHAGGGVLYFAADDGVNGKELWTSDGGTPGTVLVKDINPGLASSNPAKMVWTGLRLLFAADTAAEGRELHFSDGTPAGTLLAADMNAGTGSSNPDWLKMMGGAVYFTANNGPFGTELWVTDALGSVVNLVSDINPGATGSTPAGLTLHNGLLYFRATDPAAGLELWRSDGSGPGTTLVQDLNPGAAGAVVDGLRSAGSWLFFIASNGASGTEPFRADDCGAPAPTPTASPSPTVTTTPCDLVISGSFMLTSGIHSYCSVVVQSGGLLTINGQVTLNLSGNLQVDSGGTIRGTGNGWPAPGIQSNGNGLGGGGMGNGAGGAGGGGHGGAGGHGSNYVNGGVSFGVPTAPNQMGSSGGSGNTGMGGAGGAALAVNAVGDAFLEGSLEFNGQPGGPGGTANLSSGGGGAGGSVWISAQTISGNGFIQALGGNGGNSGCGTASCWGGGGGGGGRVALCAVLADTFVGPVNVAGGGPGAGNPMAQPGGVGTLYRCVTASDTDTPTVTPTSTATATPSDTVTITPSDTATATPSVSPSVTPTCAILSLAGTDAPGRYAFVADDINATRIVLDQPSTLNALALHLDQAGGLLALGLYSDASGPGSLLTVATPQAGVVGWNTHPVAPLALPAGTYWLAWQAQAPARITYELGVNGDSVWADDVYSGSFQPSFSSYGSMGPSNWRWAAHLVTCPDSGQAPTATPTPAACVAGFAGNPVWQDNLSWTADGLQLNALRVDVASPGWVTHLNLGVWVSSGQQLALGVYADNAGAPGPLVVQSSAVAAVSGSWNRVDVVDTYLAAGTYWLAWTGQSGLQVVYQVGAAGDEWYSAVPSFYPLPDPFGASSSSFWRWAIFAEMCPGAAPSATPSTTSTPTGTATATVTQSATPTATSSQTPSATVTASPTPTDTTTASPSATPSATESATPTATPSQTPSATVTASPTQTDTTTASPSATPSATESATPSRTFSSTPTATFTLTATETATPPPSPTATPSLTATETVTPLPSPTATPSLTATKTLSPTVTHTPFVTATPTPSITDTPLPTATPEAPAVLSHNVWRPGQGRPLRIGIKSPVGGRVTVNVYNVAAERVRRPFEADVPAGATVDAVWDGRNDQGEPCGAGVYLIGIKGAGINRVLKVVLLK